jgi:hypothetical protein
VPDVPPDACAFGSERRYRRYQDHARIREDSRRLAQYGQTWTLFLVKVAVFRRREVLGNESLAGIGEHELPLFGGRMALIEEMAERILAAQHDPHGSIPSP